MDAHGQERRSTLLDAWDYRMPFARWGIAWQEGEITPAFAADQAFAILVQETNLSLVMELFARREVLVTFSSENVMVGKRPAEREPAWVIIAAGVRRAEFVGQPGLLSNIAPGGGAVVQALIHARTGEILLGTAIPVNLRRH